MSKLSAALIDPTVHGIVVIGSGSEHFSSGADISESVKAPPEDEGPYPTIVDIVTAMYSASKPVVAGIRGVCLGGGMEVVLATDFCFGSKGCKMGLPEVKIGLIPGE